MNQLNDDDVVNLTASSNIANTTTSTVSELKEALSSLLSAHLTRGPSSGEAWVYGGVHCKVLSVDGGGWQSGKIQLRLEFVPNEPKPSSPQKSTETSPLDDLRANLG
ncbi:KGK domain family protein [Cylindrospermum sp. NIES-4074]|nr:KGK domain family protein [Cylindrospermum sp. NIES-4074]